MTAFTMPTATAHQFHILGSREAAQQVLNSPRDCVGTVDSATKPSRFVLKVAESLASLKSNGNQNRFVVESEV